MTKPGVALICTTYYAASHGDVIGTKLVEGYDFGGAYTEPRVAVASLYIEQADERDIGHALAAKHGIPVFGSIAEAMTLGGTGVNVDGVVLVGEHGDYPYNAAGQHLYPRRRFFEAAIGLMVGAGRFVPLFNDKHLSYAHNDAQWMVDTVRRLGVPLLAGSSLPLARRVPPLVWQPGTPVREAVAVYNGPVEAYGFHGLALLASFIEQWPGGETGVRRVRCVENAAFWEIAAHNRWDRELFAAALAANGGATPASVARDAACPTAFLVEYRDGLKATVCILHGAVPYASCAVRRSDGTVAACAVWLMNHQPYDHFTFLVRQIESLMLTGQPPYPVERTLLAEGILDAAMRSRHEGYRTIETPELAIAYTAPAQVADTGIGFPVPEA